MTAPETAPETDARTPWKQHVRQRVNALCCIGLGLSSRDLFHDVPRRRRGRPRYADAGL